MLVSLERLVNLSRFAGGPQKRLGARTARACRTQKPLVKKSSEVTATAIGPKKLLKSPPCRLRADEGRSEKRLLGNPAPA